MIRVISPHLDDAVLSLGDYLSTEPAVIHTVFAGLPSHKPFGWCSDFDRQAGFVTSVTAMQTRRKEDVEACAVLGALSRPMSQFVDQQYRDEAADERAIAVALIALRSQSPVHFFAPLGIGHPDHQAVSRAVRRALLPEVIYYFDLPYTVLWPELVAPAMDEIRADGWTFDPEPFPLPRGDRQLKEKAISCYRSQFPNGADDPCLLVPERAWRATRA